MPRFGGNYNYTFDITSHATLGLLSCLLGRVLSYSIYLLLSIFRILEIKAFNGVISNNVY